MIGWDGGKRMVRFEWLDTCEGDEWMSTWVGNLVGKGMDYGRTRRH